MKQVPLRDKELNEHLSSIAHDAIDTYLLADGYARLAIVNATTLVNNMRANHRLGPVSTVILGQAYICALLAASTMKDRERLALIVDTDGENRGLVAEADSEGHVRGYLRDNEIAAVDGDPFAAFGSGTIGIQRTNLADGQTFQGQVAWMPGRDVVENLAAYYATSEQTVTLMDATVHLNEKGNATGAAGLIVQLLPGADESLIDRIAEHTAAMAPVGLAFANGATASGLVRHHLSSLAPAFAGTRAAEFFCACNSERFGRFLSALPASEQDDIEKHGPFPLRTTCHNCNSTYAFDRQALAELFHGEGDAG